MLKERIWALEVRPYGLSPKGIEIIMDQMAQIKTDATNLGFAYPAIAQLLGSGEGVIDLATTDGAWVEWSRSYSYSEILGVAAKALGRFGKDNIRIIEIHEIDLAVLPNA